MDILSTLLMGILTFSGTKVNQGMNHRYVLEDQKVLLMEKYCFTFRGIPSANLPDNPCKPLEMYLEGSTTLSKPSALTPISGPSQNVQAGSLLPSPADKQYTSPPSGDNPPPYSDSTIEPQSVRNPPSDLINPPGTTNENWQPPAKERIPGTKTIDNYIPPTGQ